MRKAAELLGLGTRRVRIVPVDAAADGRRRAARCRSPATARPACGRSAWRPAPAPSTPARSTRSTRMADLCAEEDSGSTSTAPTARIGVLDRRSPGRYAGLDARRLARPRPAQVAVGAGRVRLRAGARRHAAARDVQPGPAVPPHRGRQGVRRAALVLGVRLPADARLPGPQALDDPPAPAGTAWPSTSPPPRVGPAARCARRRGCGPRALAPPSSRSCASASRRGRGEDAAASTP